MSDIVLFRSIAGFSEIFICMLAALIVLGYDLKAEWKRLLTFSLIMIIPWQLGYHIEIEAIRHLITWISSIIIYKLVFRCSWERALGNYFLALIFMAPTGILGWLALQKLLDSPQDVTELSRHFWAVNALVMPFVFSISIPVAFLIRRHIHIFKSLWLTVKNHPSQLALLCAFILQIILLYLCLDSIPASLHVQVILTGLWLIIVLLNLFIIYAVVRSTELKTISSAEDTVSNHLIYYVNSIRSRRHDMNNHLQIISGLANTDQIQELNDYIKELGQESFFYSQLMKVDNPFIGALLNAKAVAAEMKNVSLNVQIDVALTDLRGRILEIVRILGNLVDNAIEAAEQNEGEDRWVRVSTYEISPFIAFEVANHGVIEAENTASLFQPGVTSKDKYHSGLGLYSAQELAGKLHGHIQLTTEANQVKFTFLIPK